MSHNEIISFDKGLNTKKSVLLLEDGELVTAQGMSYENPGLVEPRSSKQKVSSTVIGTINGIHRNTNFVFVTDAGNVRYKWDLDGYCDLYIPPNGNFTLAGTLTGKSRPVFCDYENFTFVVTGSDTKVFLDGSWYNWDMPVPTSAPSGAAGAAGNPSGTYYLYYTYLIYFPNGTAVETAPSPAGSVTVTSQKISWTNIKPCPYAVTGLTVYRKLYRYSTGLIETYHVTTIKDNTTTTYTDDIADATLEVGSIISTEYYSSPPSNPTYAVRHLERIFCIKGCYLYPTAAYLPFNFDITEIIQATSVGDDITCAVVWGDQLCMATTSKWYRLHGNDSDTWTVKSTYAHTGVINKHTMKPTRYGILGLWHDGIYLFDGNVSKNITKDKLDKTLFSRISDIDSCYASWDGRKYYFHYPTTGTTLSKRLVIDMTGYPNIIIHNDDFIPTAHEYHDITGINYYGYAGYHYEEGGTDTCSLSIKTGDRPCKDILKEKQLEYLYYDCNTNSKPLIVNIYLDDTLAYTKTLNNSARTKDRLVLPNKQGYRIYLTITAADARGMTIYEPWSMSVNPTGV
ncbi:MAG: hypothetical protein WC332_00020 [Clostridia bacterium]|jgi:hypothetical protein